MPMQRLPQVLECAREEEARSGRLNRRLQQCLEGLPLLTGLEAAERAGHLQFFVTRYISHAPRLVQALRGAGREAGQAGLVAPLLARILSVYRLAEGEGLCELLERSYLVQRMVEEVNDRFMVMAGAPLLALDMTTANLIVHQIIGEPWANALDEEAVAAASRAMGRHVRDAERFFANTEAHRLRMWTASWQHWSEELALGAPGFGAGQS